MNQKGKPRHTVGRDHRRHGGGALAQPVDHLRMDPGDGEQQVDAAADRLVQHAPCQKDDEGRHRPRQHQQGPEQPAPIQPLVQQQRKAKTDAKLQDVARHDQNDRVPDGALERRPLGEVAEICQPDPVAGIADHAIRKGDEDRVAEWIRDEPEQHQQHGCHERVREDRVLRRRAEPPAPPSATGEQASCDGRRNRHLYLS